MHCGSERLKYCLGALWEGHGPQYMNYLVCTWDPVSFLGPKVSRIQGSDKTCCLCGEPIRTLSRASFPISLVVATHRSIYLPYLTFQILAQDR